jgi:hypothetical protein
MSLVMKENGELSKGFEILLKQVLKMLNLDPAVTIGQINGIHSLMVRHVAQQDEILARLKRIEDGQGNLSADGTHVGQTNGSTQQSS